MDAGAGLRRQQAVPKDGSLLADTLRWASLSPTQGLLAGQGRGTGRI